MIGWLPLNGSNATFTLANRPDVPAWRDALADDGDRRADRLAVADQRLADAHLQVEVALHAVLLDLQVQHAHAGHQRLARLRVHLPVEGRVLALEDVQRVGQLLLVGRRLRLDRLADDAPGRR